MASSNGKALAVFGNVRAGVDVAAPVAAFAVLVAARAVALPAAVAPDATAPPVVLAALAAAAGAPDMAAVT